MNTRISNIAKKRIKQAIWTAIFYGKVKPIYLAIGDINVLLNDFDCVDDYAGFDPAEYGDYNNPFGTLHYISDRFVCPGRLIWLKHGIENRLFKNLDEYFCKEEKQNATTKN